MEPRRGLASTPEHRAKLQWDPKKELGYYEIEGTWYNDGYFEASQKNAESAIAHKLNRSRIGIVNKYANRYRIDMENNRIDAVHQGRVLDFGPGFGHFVFSRRNTYGFDICKKAREKLEKAGLFFDPHEKDLDEYSFKVVTLFDVIEHLKDPRIILDKIKSQFLIITLPIFEDKAHILRSKHFKIMEHYWYFTKKSIIEYMAGQGFKEIECRTDEIKIGREDIYTYVFKR